MRINYIQALNWFYEYLAKQELSANAQLLYHTLLLINNKCCWEPWFSRTLASLAAMTRLGEKALTLARAQLKERGLIDYRSTRVRGEVTQYMIIPPQYRAEANGTDAVETPHRGFTDDSQTRDIIKSKKEKENYIEASAERNEKPVPANDIRLLYDKLCPSFPKLVKLTPGRLRAMDNCWDEFPELAFFENAFYAAENSVFLKTRASWRPNFDWIMKPENMLGLLEGKYSDSKLPPSKYPKPDYTPGGPCNPYKLRNRDSEK